jgi:hypothetical protein
LSTARKLGLEATKDGLCVSENAVKLALDGGLRSARPFEFGFDRKFGSKVEPCALLNLAKDCVNSVDGIECGHSRTGDVSDFVHVDVS